MLLAVLDAPPSPTADDPVTPGDPPSPRSGTDHPRWHLAARRLSNMLLLGALAMVAFPLVTMAYAAVAARGADDDYARFAESIAAGLPRIEAGAGSDAFGEAAAAFGEQIEPGDPIGRLRIRRIDLDAVAREGSGALLVDGFDRVLNLGPSHLTWSSLPGQGGNVAIAGHRTTYTHPFWSLDEMRRGDRIVLDVPYGTFTYRVTRVFEISPDDTGVAKDHGFEQLTLSTCTPRHSAARRLIVHARLVSATPADAVLAHADDAGGDPAEGARP